MQRSFYQLFLSTQILKYLGEFFNLPEGEREKKEEEKNTMLIDTSEIWTAWWKYVHLLLSNSQVEIFLNPRNQIIC